MSLDPADQPEVVARDRAAFRRGLLISALFVTLLYWLKAWEIWRGEPLQGLAIHPRALGGLIGVLTSPFVHGSLAHLVANSLPLLVLGTIAFWAYPRTTPRAVALIWLASGIGTWLVGRDSGHIGASGVAHGLMFLLFTLGVLRRDRPAIAAGLVAFFLYGGMMLTVLPRQPDVSWEAHLFGALGGLAAAVLWRRRDPEPPRKKYSWELEEELAATQAALDKEQYELPRPEHVPVLWQRPAPAPPDEPRSNVVMFPGARARDIDDEPPSTTRH